MLRLVKFLIVVFIFVFFGAFAYESSFSNIIKEVHEKYHTKNGDWCDVLQEQISDIVTKAGGSVSYEKLLDEGIDTEYLDLMALEYCKKHKDAFIAIIWPRVSYSYEKFVYGMLGKYCKMVYCKKFTLKNNGPRTLLFSIPEKRAFPGHYSSYFPKNMKEYPMMCFVMRADNVQAATKAKKAIRQMLQIEPFSVHVNDNHEQCLDLAYMLLNDNSLHFLNNHKPRHFNNFPSLVEKYKNFIKSRGLAEEDFCIDGSSVLSAYGIRDCAVDLDFLSTKQTDLGDIWPLDHHNVTWTRLGLDIDDIIYNPKNFFFFEGVKFASLSVIRSFKEKQARDNDKKDVMLIDSFLRARNK